jgi:hypothetical protein
MLGACRPRRIDPVVAEPLLDVLRHGQNVGADEPATAGDESHRFVC